MAEPHRMMLEDGRKTSTGWDINAVSSLPEELLHTMGISLPSSHTNGSNDNEDPTSETSDDASVNSDNTQQTSSTQMNKNTTSSKHGSTPIRSPSLSMCPSSTSTKNKLNTKSNFDQMVTGKLQDSLISNLRRSSSSVINIDKSNGISLLRQSQRSPSSSSLQTNGSQRGLSDIIDRNTTTAANADSNSNMTASSSQIKRRASSVTSPVQSTAIKSPRTLPKIGAESVDNLNSALLASSQKELNRSRSSSVDIFPVSASLLNSSSNPTPSSSSSSHSNHNPPDRSPTLMGRKSSLLSSEEQKQVMMSVLSLSGKSDINRTDTRLSGSCKVRY